MPLLVSVEFVWYGEKRHVSRDLVLLEVRSKGKINAVLGDVTMYVWSYMAYEPVKRRSMYVWICISMCMYEYRWVCRWYVTVCTWACWDACPSLFVMYARYQKAKRLILVVMFLHVSEIRNFFSQKLQSRLELEKAMTWLVWINQLQRKKRPCLSGRLDCRQFGQISSFVDVWLRRYETRDQRKRKGKSRPLPSCDATPQLDKYETVALIWTLLPFHPSHFRLRTRPLQVHSLSHCHGSVFSATFIVPSNVLYHIRIYILLILV